MSKSTFFFVITLFLSSSFSAHAACKTGRHCEAVEAALTSNRGTAETCKKFQKDRENPEFWIFCAAVRDAFFAGYDDSNIRNDVNSVLTSAPMLPHHRLYTAIRQGYMEHLGKNPNGKNASAIGLFKAGLDYVAQCVSRKQSPGQFEELNEQLEAAGELEFQKRVEILKKSSNFTEKQTEEQIEKEKKKILDFLPNFIVFCEGYQDYLASIDSSKAGSGVDPCKSEANIAVPEPVEMFFEKISKVGGSSEVLKYVIKKKHIEKRKNTPSQLRQSHVPEEVESDENTSPNLGPRTRSKTSSPSEGSPTKRSRINPEIAE